MTSSTFLYIIDIFISSARVFEKYSCIVIINTMKVNIIFIAKKYIIFKDNISLKCEKLFIILFKSLYFKLNYKDVDILFFNINIFILITLYASSLYK